MPIGGVYYKNRKHPVLEKSTLYSHLRVFFKISFIRKICVTLILLAGNGYLNKQLYTCERHPSAEVNFFSAKFFEKKKKKVFKIRILVLFSKTTKVSTGQIR